MYKEVPTREGLSIGPERATYLMLDRVRQDAPDGAAPSTGKG